MEDISQELIGLLTEYQEANKASGTGMIAEKAILKDHPEFRYLYALSVMRENLLEWFEFDPAGTLLQIGSGYGALTGLLAGRVKEVVVADPSRENLAVNRKRHEECGNISFVQCGLEDMTALGGSYDYIVMMGEILMESCCGADHGLTEDKQTEAEQSEAELALLQVQKVLTMLKPGGQLIMTAANRLGLKYLAGAKPHEISLYQKEIRNMFAQQKGKLEFYYPLPDDRFPVSIYSEGHLPSMGEVPYSVLTAYDFPEYTRFELEKWHDMLCEAGEFRPFANSFLIIWSSYEED